MYIIPLVVFFSGTKSGAGIRERVGGLYLEGLTAKCTNLDVSNAEGKYYRSLVKEIKIVPFPGFLSGLGLS